MGCWYAGMELCLPIGCANTVNEKSTIELRNLNPAREPTAELEFVTLRSPSIDSKESIPQAYAAWRNRFLGIDSWSS